MWNDIPADNKLCKSMFTFKQMYKALLLQPYQFSPGYIRFDPKKIATECLSR